MGRRRGGRHGGRWCWSEGEAGDSRGPSPVHPQDEGSPLPSFHPASSSPLTTAVHSPTPGPSPRRGHEVWWTGLEGRKEVGGRVDWRWEGGWKGAGEWEGGQGAGGKAGRRWEGGVVGGTCKRPARIMASTASLMRQRSSCSPIHRIMTRPLPLPRHTSCSPPRHRCSCSPVILFLLPPVILFLLPPAIGLLLPIPPYRDDRARHTSSCRPCLRPPCSPPLCFPDAP